MSSTDVLSVFGRYSKGKSLNTKEVFRDLMEMKVIPKKTKKKNQKKNKKALNDRLYILSKKGDLVVDKKTGKNIYRLSY